MKKLKILFVSALLVCNVAILTFNAKANVKPTPQAGIAGSINHIPTCHCPDDARSCYCDIKN